MEASASLLVPNEELKGPHGESDHTPGPRVPVQQRSQQTQKETNTRPQMQDGVKGLVTCSSLSCFLSC